MTTIIANDKFMIADHRATTLVHQEDNHDDYIQKTAKSAFDKLKIFDKAPEQYFNVKNDNSDYII